MLDRETDDTIRSVVTGRLGRSRRTAGFIDDVIAETHLRLLRRLEAARTGDDDPVAHLPSYARTIAANACHELLRREFPDRARLRNKIRYVLTHHPGLSLTETAPGLWHSQAVRLRRPAAAGSTRQLVDSPHTFASTRRIDTRAPLGSLLPALLEACEAPVELDELVDAVALLLGVSDAQAIPPSRRDDGAQIEIPDPAPTVLTQMEQREVLRAVWTELCALPHRQRSALLLNLRDADGSAMLQTLPATGVVTREGIAKALGLSDAELTQLWPDLPLDDLAIAARLGISRQQVINLRKSGRARLARRTGNIPPRPSSTR